MHPIGPARSTALAFLATSICVSCGVGLLRFVRAVGGFRLSRFVATEEQFEQVDAILGPDGRRITGCERIVPLDEVPEGHGEDYMMLFTYRAGMTFPAGLQWSLAAPRMNREAAWPGPPLRPMLCTEASIKEKSRRRSYRRRIRMMTSNGRRLEFQRRLPWQRYAI